MDRRLVALRDVLYSQFYESPYLTGPRAFTVRGGGFEIEVSVAKEPEAFPIAKFWGTMNVSQFGRLRQADRLARGKVREALERGGDTAGLHNKLDHAPHRWRPQRMED